MTLVNNSLLRADKVAEQTSGDGASLRHFSDFKLYGYLLEFRDMRSPESRNLGQIRAIASRSITYAYAPDTIQDFSKENSDIAKGRGHRAEGRREKIEGLKFQYLARVLIALATAIPNPDFLPPCWATYKTLQRRSGGLRQRSSALAQHGAQQQTSLRLETKRGLYERIWSDYLLREVHNIALTDSIEDLFEKQEPKIIREKYYSGKHPSELERDY